MIINKIQECLYTFIPNKPFGSLLEISPTNHVFLKKFNSEYDEIKLWFTDQNSKPLEIEDRINLTIVIKGSICYKNEIINWTKRLNKEQFKVTGDVIGNKTADKITSVSKKKSNNNNDNNNNINNNNNNEHLELTTDKKRYISPEERQQIIDELILILKKTYTF